MRWKKVNIYSNRLSYLVAHMVLKIQPNGVLMTHDLVGIVFTVVQVVEFSVKGDIRQ